MIKLPVTLGMTLNSRDGSYKPVFDGYRPGSEQLMLELGLIEIPGLHEGAPLTLAEAEQVAEWCFEAMNAPATSQTLVIVGDIAQAMRVAIAQLKKDNFSGWENTHSLQVGDTVTVGDITVSCGRFGWDRVAA